MRPLRYSINVTLDGCCDHRAIVPDEELHRRAAKTLAQADAASRNLAFALAIGAVFLCGGIMASFMIPAPAWFIALDLVAAYIPMAWLAARGTVMTGRSAPTAAPA